MSVQVKLLLEQLQPIQWMQHECLMPHSQDMARRIVFGSLALYKPA
ncbi:MAG: hypothetical protein KME45_17610 [Stenomitos rutilans HA7619-LM2]|nr:hypothetical protein [Stenomitos rutilans HA7619-LM2]